MNRKIPWIDMIGFYLLLPVLSVMTGWISLSIYREKGGIGFLLVCLFFCGFTCFLLYSSVGIFFVRLMDGMGKAIENAFRKTWDMMVDTMIEAQSSR